MPAIYPELLRGGTAALQKWEAVNCTKWSTTIYIVLRHLIMQATKRERGRGGWEKSLKWKVYGMLGAKKHIAEEWRIFLASAAGDKLQGFVWFVFLEIL